MCNKYAGFDIGDGLFKAVHIPRFHANSSSNYLKQMANDF